MTTVPAYGDLTEAEQLAVLRPVAQEAAVAFGLSVHRLEVLLHGYNTTYELQTSTGQRFAMRLNTNSTSSPQEAAAQQAWQQAIGERTTVRVPVPVATTDGTWCATVPAPALGRSVLATCAHWLPGPNMGEPSAPVARELGRVMARLHQQSAQWAVPAGTSLPRLDDPLFGEPNRLFRAALTPEQHEVLDETLRRAITTFTRIYDGVPAQVIHADLHGGNLKWHDGQLSVFDFDDCGLGVPVLDLAISTFYLRGNAVDGEPAMREGYASICPLPQVTADDFETLLAARQLLLANAILGSTTSQFREMARTYLPTAVHRLSHWLQSGQFTRAVP